MSEKLIKEFYQGIVRVSESVAKCLDDSVHGNCVTIALIKCALGQFGSLENIFLSFSLVEEVLSVEFKDGYQLEVTQEDIQISKELSGIKKNHNSELYEDAMRLYAIICKRIFLTKEEYSSSCIQNFENAVEFINCGYPTKEAYKLLALDKRALSPKHLKQTKNAIIYSGAHASYCSLGIQDIYGRENKIKNRLFGYWMKNPKGIGSFISGAYQLV